MSTGSSKTETEDMQMPHCNMRQRRHVTHRLKLDINWIHLKNKTCYVFNTSNYNNASSNVLLIRHYAQRQVWHWKFKDPSRNISGNCCREEPIKIKDTQFIFIIIIPSSCRLDWNPLFICSFLQDAGKGCLTREDSSSAGIRLIWSGEVRGERVVRGVRGEGNVSQAL